MTAVPARDAIPTIELSDFEIEYHNKVHAVHPTNLTVQSGQWLALLGPNGSGKSSLLRAIATLTRPTRGRVRIFGRDPASSRTAEREARLTMGVIFQSPALDALLTVRENLALAAAVYSVPEHKNRITYVAAMLGISDRLDQRVATLSGGLARRADLARALIPSPNLLLLDEPTSGLDLESRLRFLDTISTLHSTGNLTVIYATHHMDEAERADRVVMLDAGTIVADDSPGALKALHTGVRIHFESDAPEEFASRLSRGVDASEQELEQLILDLTRAGVRFRVGPPTLADVYLERTGSPLEWSQ